MNSSAAAQLGPSLRFLLAVKSGPDKGAKYQLLPPRVTIGRGQENNIALTDPRVSRNHAVIEFRAEQIVVIDVSSRGNLLLNGETVSEAQINHGDVIAIGESELLFRIQQIEAPQNLARMGGVPATMSPMGTAPAPHSGSDEPRRGPESRRSSRNRSRSTGSDGNRMVFYLVVLGVGGLFTWLMTSETAVKKETGIRTSGQVETEIRDSEERQGLLSKKREFKSQEERTRFEEANGHYLQGFRDYQKGNFARALRSFETARAIDPNHEMATRYYQLSIRKRDELIARHLLDGRRYKEKNMYSRCVSSMNAALKNLGDVNTQQDLKAKEAETLRNECEALMKGGL